jgi:hypothetical protein
MTKFRLASLVALAAAALAACNRPSAPAEKSASAPPPAATAAAPAPSERPSRVAWDPKAGGFSLNGKPLTAARAWTFDADADGWTGVGASLWPAEGGGLSVANAGADPILLSPAGLAINGAQNPLVVIRLTRTKTGGQWSGALFYATAGHPMAEGFRGKPLDPRDLAVNETATLVYDMAKPAKGDGDWMRSVITQLRFDTDDQPGGEFVIHQIAVANNPDPAALGAP